MNTGYGSRYDYCIDEGAPVSVQLGATKLVKKARKDHLCSTCGQTIPKGKSYWKTAWLIDDTFYQQKNCGRCPDY